MEFVGINLGAYSTTIASSKDKRRMYEDEFGKKAIKTLMELSTPVRRFGNAVSDDTERGLALKRHISRRETEGHFWVLQM